MVNQVAAAKTEQKNEIEALGYKVETTEQKFDDSVQHNEQTFENIRHTDEYGNEYWLARELQGVLEYAQWRRFLDAVERAKLACKNSGYNVSDHFADVGKMVKVGSGTEREVEDVKLSRYACYLIVMNGDPRKEVIAVGFAVRGEDADAAWAKEIAVAVQCDDLAEYFKTEKQGTQIPLWIK